MCEIEKSLCEIGKSLREIRKSLYEKLKLPCENEKMPCEIIIANRDFKIQDATASRTRWPIKNWD